mmetsp:Transcript_39371/g.111558  ORF Transcript_39371/g.111558 Transcript_39371/m.111558 type:complete len:260 (-) Transcript_39371:377-1156(-)
MRVCCSRRLPSSSLFSASRTPEVLPGAENLSSESIAAAALEAASIGILGSSSSPAAAMATSSGRGDAGGAAPSSPSLLEGCSSWAPQREPSTAAAPRPSGSLELRSSAAGDLGQEALSRSLLLSACSALSFPAPSSPPTPPPTPAGEAAAVLDGGGELPASRRRTAASAAAVAGSQRSNCEVPPSRKSLSFPPPPSQTASSSPLYTLAPATVRASMPLSDQLSLEHSLKSWLLSSLKSLPWPVNIMCVSSWTRVSRTAL